MRICRLHTVPGRDPLKDAKYRIDTDEYWTEYTVPQSWSRAATALLIEKVFYKDPLPALVRKIPEDGVPEWLWRAEPDDSGLDSISAEWRYRYERDIRDVLRRVAGSITYRSFKTGIFDSAEDVRAFHDEFLHVILNQMVMPETALLATAGLDWAYGIAPPPYTPRQTISSFGKSAVGGIAVPLHAPQQVLRRIKILGMTRALDDAAQEAAVILPVENAESAAFIGMKRRRDIDSAATLLGRRMLSQAVHQVMDAADRSSLRGFSPANNPALTRAAADARAAGVSENFIALGIDYARQGFEEVELGGGVDDAEPENSLKTVLSVPDAFIESAMTGHSFALREGDRILRHANAEKLLDKTCESIWQTGQPGLLFRDSVLAAAPFLAEADCLGQSASGGFIFAADATAPAAALNLMAYEDARCLLRAEEAAHATRLLVIALDAAAPDGARRPVCIGITNVSALLMTHALSYDSDEGRTAAALAAALVSGAAHLASAEIAAEAGAFPAYSPLEKPFLQSLKDKIALLSGHGWSARGSAKRRPRIKTPLFPSVEEHARRLWEEAYARGKSAGFRHAHLTAIDTDIDTQVLLAAQTFDLAPEKSLVRFEGYFAPTGDGPEIYGKKLNPAVPPALMRLGYRPSDIDDIHFYAVGHGTLFDAPHINHASLKRNGFPQASIDAIEAALKTAQHIRYVFNKWTLGEDFCVHMLGFSKEHINSPSFDMLASLGFSEDDIEEANLYCCGAMTLEGAPHLRPDHLAVFDCGAPLTQLSVRRVSPEAQVRMQSAVEAFLSGAAAHRIELEHYAPIDAVRKLVLLGWELGVKHLALYRHGSSLLHPAAPAESGAAPRAKEPDLERTLEKAAS